MVSEYFILEIISPSIDLPIFKYVIPSIDLPKYKWKDYFCLVCINNSLHVAVNYTLISLIVILNLTQWFCCGKIIIKTLNVTKLSENSSNDQYTVHDNFCFVFLITLVLRCLSDSRKSHSKTSISFCLSGILLYLISGKMSCLIR